MEQNRNLSHNLGYSMKKTVANITTETVKYMQKNMGGIKKTIISCQGFLIILTFCLISFSAQAEYHKDEILKSASELDYPPFAIVQPNGSADGFLSSF